MDKNKTNKIVLMFPGQGSQSLHMGNKFLSNNIKYKKYFNISSEVLGQNILDIINNKDDKGVLLQKTQFSQIAIYTLSCAIFSYILDSFSLKNDCIDTVLGHSLGEYSALFTCGALNFKKGAELVVFRGKIMGNSSISGGMAAVIGLDKCKILNVLKDYTGKVFIANYNDYSQIVISGYRKDLESASVKLKQKGAKRVIPLKVSIASHCHLMLKASRNLERFIKDNILFSDFKYNFFSTTEVSYIGKDGVRNVLVNQLINPIKWVESIEYLLKKNLRIFIEIGPGRVLCELVKRIALKNGIKDVPIFNTNDWDDIINLGSFLKEEGLTNEA